MAPNDRGVERPKFLERWMASYLAELLAKEKIATGKARATVRAEIASVVPALWELQLARDALAVRVQVDWWERRVQESDDATAALLRQVLENPQSSADISPEKAESVLRWLANAEDLFQRYLFALREAQKAAASTAPGRDHEVVIVFGRRDEQIADLRKAVFKLLPGLSSIDPNDVHANRRVLGAAIVKAMTARFTLASLLAERESTAGSDGTLSPTSPKSKRKKSRRK